MSVAFKTSIERISGGRRAIKNQSLDSLKHVYYSILGCVSQSCLDGGKVGSYEWLPRSLVRIRLIARKDSILAPWSLNW